MSNNKPICKFYKNGKCKNNKDCQFEHPRICKKFWAFGLKKFNEKGCDEKCGEFHTNACLDSLQNKTCPRKDCRFFYLKGTKPVEWKFS